MMNFLGKQCGATATVFSLEIIIINGFEDGRGWNVIIRQLLLIFRRNDFKWDWHQRALTFKTEQSSLVAFRFDQ